MHDLAVLKKINAKAKPLHMGKDQHVYKTPDQLCKEAYQRGYADGVNKTSGTSEPIA